MTIPDFHHNIIHKIGPIIFFVCNDFAKSGRNIKKNSIGPVLFLTNKESMVSSNFNSKLFQFLSAYPNLYINAMNDSALL